MDGVGVGAGEEVLVVQARGEWLAIPLSIVREVRRPDLLAPVPGVTEIVLGVQNLRGKIVAVVDLGAALALPGQAASMFEPVVAKRARRVVCSADGVDVALAVDAVDGVCRLGSDPVPPPDGLRGTMRSVCTGVHDDGTRLAAVLSTGLVPVLQAQAVPA